MNLEYSRYSKNVPEFEKTSRIQKKFADLQKVCGLRKNFINPNIIHKFKNICGFQNCSWI